VAALGDLRGQADVLRTSAQFARTQGARRRSVERFERRYALYCESGALFAAAQVAMVMGDMLLRVRRPAPARQRYGDAVAHWVKEKYGLSWQITPRRLLELMDPDVARAKRVMDAMMQMKRIDIAAIERAAGA